MGLLCIPITPITQFPEIAPAQVSITAVYTGADARTVESAVTNILEQEVNGLEGVKYITSSSTNNGLSNITLVLESGANVDDVIIDAQNKIKRVEAKLPDNVKRNGVTVEKNSTSIILAFALYSEHETHDKFYITDYVHRYILDELKRIDGVGSVEIFGERKYAMRIWLDPLKLSQYKLTPIDISNSLREQNVQLPAGQIGQPPYNNSNYQISLKALSQLKSVKEFENIIIKQENNIIIKLKDLAHIELGAEDYNTVLRYQGFENMVGGLVTQAPNSNALTVEKNVLNKLNELKADFPADLDYRIAFNPTTYVRTSIKEVVGTLLIAILLVVLVIFAFIQNWRSTLIPAITIPVSLLSTFLFIKVFGFSINTLTLFGLTLATGLVVDDAIVVLENIIRLIQQEKLSVFKATSQSMRELSGAVVATTLVLIAVFVPISFFPGTTGKLYQQFALTISFSLVVSSFCALTLAPALAVLIINSNKLNSPATNSPKELIFRPFNRFIKKFKYIVQKILVWLFRRQFIAGIFYILCIGGILFFYKFLPQSFLPQEDQGYFMVVIQAPEGSSLEYTNKITKKVEYLLSKEKDVSGLFAVNGFSFMGSGANKAMIFANLHEFDKRKSPSQSSRAVIGRLMPKFASMPDAQIFAFEPPAVRGLGRFGGFQYELKGNSNISLEELSQQANNISMQANAAKEMVGVFSSYTVNTPQITVEVNRDYAKSLGINIRDIFRTLQIYLGSEYVDDFEMRNKIYKIYTQAEGKYRANPDNLQSFYVKSNTGELIPMSSLVKLKEQTSPPIINHFNMYRSASINGSTMWGYSLGDAITKLESISQNILPKDFSFEWSGIAREQKESQGATIILLTLGIVFAFLILAAQYESFFDPLIILLVVPLAIAGGLAGQFIRGLENDVYCQIGLVVLIGSASKNSILIVEYANQLKEQGYNTLRAIITATMTRFRPILMTSWSFVLGIIPLVIATGAGSAGRHSIGTVIMCGMIFATLLSLFIVPIIYFNIKSQRDKH